MKERDGGIGAIIAVMAVITGVYAYLAGYVQMPKEWPAWTGAKAPQMSPLPVAQLTPVSVPVPAKPRKPACEGEIKGGFCVLK